ncbi:MAG: hypothetical protein EPN98_07865 [Phenylobacterium sp.]|uniref:tetratricopeptide repeat protein n=1 Tax=Phenylobacterium sp. TaxID=1871053 RepID=UPI001217845F|nr:hypothetical protein [Phenylobacterium sp.]TAL34963.1 MAG: hypothetical protein EPN98_07865 [Phenylobacterium sp.]
MAQAAKPLHVAPDRAIHGAQAAVSSGRDLDQALAAVEEQIRAARQALRGVYLDAVELTARRDRDPQARLQHMLGTLHICAALLCRSQGDEHQAHEHWVRAVATGTTDPSPRQYLVESYLARGRPLDALSQLEMMGNGRHDALSLLMFGRDMRVEGHLDVADLADARAIAADPSGLVGDVVAAARTRYPTAAPSAEATPSILQRISRAFTQGNRGADLMELRALVGAMPRSADAWFELAALIQIGDRAIDGSVIHDAVQELVASQTLDDDRLKALDQAGKGYEFAFGLAPYDAKHLLALAVTYALLERWTDALELLNGYRQAAPKQALGHALFAIVARLADEDAAAEAALDQARAIDPNNPLVGLARQAGQARDLST